MAENDCMEKKDNPLLNRIDILRMKLDPPKRGQPIVQISRQKPLISSPLVEDVPVLGTAPASILNSFTFANQPIDYVARPPALMHVRNAYAVYVANDSMEPVHSRGDLRFVNTDRPPKTGETIILHEKTNKGTQAYIKIFENETTDWIVCSQLNFKAKLKFSRDTVKAVHKVQSTNELFNR